jgi:hypothetical protein
MIQSQVKTLMKGISMQGDRHLAEVEADLAQTRMLLTEAVEKLSAAFLAIHAEISAEHKAMAGAPKENDYWRAVEIALLEAVRDRVAQHVGAAVTGLQFQDMVSQLIERTTKRVAGVRGALTELGNAGELLDEGSDKRYVEQTLGGLNQGLAAASQELNGSLRRTVNQRHMGCGDIELF